MRTLKRTARKWSIRTKFLSVIVGVVLVFSVMVAYFSWSYTNAQMKEHLDEKAKLALEFDLAIRTYVAERIRPFAEECVGREHFVPEVMSTSFVARNIFEKVKEKFPDCIIKFSSDDPRNPRNQAGPEELKMIKYFNENPKVQIWRGSLNLNGQPHQAVFSARRMKEECLRCHGDPKDAPEDLLTTYGDVRGFHRPVGQVVALDMVAIPMGKHKSAAAIQTEKIFVVALLGLGFLLAATYYAFHVLVGRKLTTISDHFSRIGTQENDSLISRIDYEGDDEIGVLVRSFNSMAENLQNTTTSRDDLNREMAHRKQVEDRIQRKNKFLSSVLDSLTYPFYVIDADSYIIKMANGAACGEDLIGKATCYNVSHRRDKPCEGTSDPCPIAEIKETKKPVVIEHIHYNKEGNLRNVEVHAYPIFDDEGNVSEIIEYTLDITERKRAEKEREEQRKVLETVFAAAPVGMLLVDDNLVIKQVNHVMTKLVGKDVSEITDKRAGEGLDCIHSYENKAGCGHGPACSSCPIRKGIESLFETGQSINGVEIQATFVIDGQPMSIWLEVDAALVTLSDRKYAILALNNIDERKKAESELKETHKKLIEAAHKMGMGEVATNILHNVGNVLNSINVSAYSIRDTMLNSRAKNLKKIIDMIAEHTHELEVYLTKDERGKHIPLYLAEAAALIVNEHEDITEKINALTKHIEHVKQIIQSQQKYAKVGGVEVLTSIRELIEDAVEINKEGLTRHEVHLQLELSELPMIHIDRQRVLQILVNLISNGKYAVSQSDKEERLLIIRSYSYGENRLRIDVVDNGIGISKENIPKIFQYGFTTKEDGHGFGLHSSFFAARELGGSLIVHSDGPGHGARFTLELPLKSEAVIETYAI